MSLLLPADTDSDTSVTRDVAAWHAPMLVKMSLKRTLAGNGSMTDGIVTTASDTG